ncbi:IclR family transcriptional regulator [Bifidobacterium callitrichos]|uniref:IclR family transcriptional regulator n=1 Tax=Bifidobacterium callitrichos TaxID=762209 RepID=A0A2T3GD55_9BIFI|nr:IclR family transcriptional regulator [Bifidobacterium callitrichos]PST47415.1 IclR family transcriptional regulator [Bifidobacterium callitrichos]
MNRGTTQEPTRALAKAGKVVNALAEENDIGPVEITERCDIPRSSAYRILDGLANVGLVETSGDMSYSLSLDWLALADAARRSMTEWAGAPQLLRELTGETGVTSFLSVVDGEETVCVECARGHGVDALILRPVGTLPFHAGAAGRVALAYSAPEIVERYLAKAPFRGYNLNTLVTERALRADMEETHSRGYAFSDEDVTIGVCSVGVPLLADGSPYAVGSLSVGGFVDVVKPRRDEIAATLHTYANRLMAGWHR